MLHLIEILFELSVLSMAFSFLLIYIIFEAAAREPVIIKKADSRNAILYFILLILTAISSLTILLISNHFADDSMHPLFNYIPVVFFIGAMFVLCQLVFKMYKVIPDLIMGEKQKAPQVKKEVADEDVV